MDKAMFILALLVGMILGAIIILVVNFIRNKNNENKASKMIEQAKKEAEKQKSFEELSIEDHVEMYEKQGFDHKEAMKKAAKDRGITKRDIYQYLLNVKK